MKRSKIEIRTEILTGAKELFFKKNYSDVTTDQIAKKANISKKTLYRYFISKKEILEKVVCQVISSLSYKIYGILLKNDLSYPEKLKQIITTFAISLSTITTNFLEDIQKNAPDIWKKVNEFKKDTVTNHFGKLFDEGVLKGKINININKEIAILIMLSSIDNLLNPIFLKQLPKEILKNIPNSAYEIYNQIIKVLYEGILTEKTKRQYSLNKTFI